MSLTSSLHMWRIWLHFQTLEYNNSWKMKKFQLFPFKSLGNQNWPWCKTDQGQPRVMVYIKLCSTLDPNVTYHVSRQLAQWFWRRFFKVLSILSMVAILVMWPGPFIQTFVPPSQWDSIWNLALIGLAVSEEKMFEIVDHDQEGRWSMGIL